MKRLTSKGVVAIVLAAFLQASAMADEQVDAPVQAEDESAAEVTSDTATPEKYDWAVTPYVAWLSGDQLGDMLLFQAELSDNQVWVLALTRRLTTFYKDVDWEVEAQVGKHGGPGPGMRHWEINGLTSLRWNRFIWDKYVDTSLAAGLGLSYATEKPEFEIEEHGATNRLLTYILVELTLSPPRYPQWAAVMRIHHRSSAYGTFEEDIEGASNSLGFGIKYSF